MILNHILDAPYLKLDSTLIGQDRDSINYTSLSEVADDRIVSTHWNDQMKDGILHVFEIIRTLDEDNFKKYMDIVIDEKSANQNSNSLSRDSNKENNYKEKSQSGKGNNNNVVQQKKEMIGVNFFPTRQK